MEEKEVRSILVEELTQKDTTDAQMAAYLTILSKLLGKAIRQLALADAKKLELLKNIAYAKSRLCLFATISPDSTFSASEDVLKDGVFLYKTWLEVVDFLSENYDSLDLEFRTAWSKETLSEKRAIVAERYEKHRKQLETDKTLFLNKHDFAVMGGAFNWTIRLILGKEIFLGFAEEFGKALEVLRKYEA